MLKVLSKYGVKATFFVQGEFAKARPHMLRQMYQFGHLIGNHSYKHVTDFPRPKDFHQSLLRTHNIIVPYIGRENYRLYRAPGGVWTKWREQHGNSHPELRKYIGPFFWNVGGGTPNRQDDADWKCWRRGNGVTVRMCADSYYRQIIKNYNKNQASLVLLHDLNALSARMLDRVLSRLERDGVNWEFRLADDMPIVEEMAWYQF
jgi:peptidoglycan/xylan/chitin deacetylase (PgdA/CDA1 family)